MLPLNQETADISLNITINSDPVHKSGPSSSSSNESQAETEAHTSGHGDLNARRPERRIGQWRHERQRERA